MTQATLAHAAGVSRPTLIDIEWGKDSVGLGLTLRVLAALDLIADIVPAPPPASGPVDLDEHLRDA